MKSIKYIILGVYIAGLVILGVRPKIKIFYDTFLPDSDIGGWCMYQRHVSHAGILTVDDGTSVQELDWENYINHGSFTSSPHPKLSKHAMQSFLDFLAENHPDITQIRNNKAKKDALILRFEIVKVIEDRDSTRVAVSKTINVK